MKGRRDEYSCSHEFKLPHSSSMAEYNGHDESEGEIIPSKSTTNDALRFIKQVKLTLEDQTKYDLFLQLMKTYRSQRIDTVGVINRVKDLFKGHNNLIYGFNAFLPKGYEIIIPDEDLAPPPTIDDAVSFVTKLKERFSDDQCHVYQEFLDVMNKYRKEGLGIDEVIDEIGGLFEDHPDLFVEFRRFASHPSLENNLTHRDKVPYGRNNVAQPDQNHDEQHYTNSQMDIDEDIGLSSDATTFDLNNPSSISSSLLFAISSLSIS